MRASFFVISSILLLAVSLLTGCASSGTEVQTATTASTTSYQEVPWAKLWNSAFADEFDGKRVRLEAMWIGVAQSLMDVSAGFKPYNSGNWVEVGITTVGDEEMMGQYKNQKWSVYIPKNNSDVAFSLGKGSHVMIYGVARKKGFGSAVGGDAQLTSLVLEIEKIEESR